MNKQKRGEARRQQILRSAERLFRQQGFSGTSMRQIAEAAGFGSAVSGLYNHYPNKAAIFEALLISRSPYEDLIAALESVEGDTLHNFLRNWFRTLWPVMSQHLDFLQLVFIDLQEFEGRTMAHFLSGFIPRYIETFSPIQQFPEVRKDLPLPLLVRTVASVMIGYMMTEMMVQKALANELPFPLAAGDEWLEGLTHILVSGISERPEQP